MWRAISLWDSELERGLNLISNWAIEKSLWNSTPWLPVTLSTYTKKRPDCRPHSRESWLQPECAQQWFARHLQQYHFILMTMSVVYDAIKMKMWPSYTSPGTFHTLASSPWHYPSLVLQTKLLEVEKTWEWGWCYVRWMQVWFRVMWLAHTHPTMHSHSNATLLKSFVTRVGLQPHAG